MTSARTLAIVVAGVAIALAAAGCTAEAPPAFTVRDTTVVVRSGAAFTRTADFPERVESTIDAALRYWGGEWGRLAGKIVVFDADRHVACGADEVAVGCYDGDIRVSTEDAGVTLGCVEQTVLVHEVGHAVVGDPAHLDARWMDFTSLARDLEGRTGYGAAGEASCPISLAMWRQPPRR